MARGFFCNAMVGEVLDGDFDALRAPPELARCEVCRGTGLSVEGWDCVACDGEGAFDL